MRHQPFLLGTGDFGLLHFKCLQRPEKLRRGHGVEGVEKGFQTGDDRRGFQPPPPLLPEEYMVTFFPDDMMFSREAGLECLHNALPVEGDTADELVIGAVVGGKSLDRDFAFHPSLVKGMIEQSGLYAHGILPAIDAL
jgi:hypothetical protein